MAQGTCLERGGTGEGEGRAGKREATLTRLDLQTAVSVGGIPHAERWACAAGRHERLPDPSRPRVGVWFSALRLLERSLVRLNILAD